MIRAFSGDCAEARIACLSRVSQSRSDAFAGWVYIVCFGLLVVGIVVSVSNGEGVKVWWEGVQCTKPPWPYLNILNLSWQCTQWTNTAAWTKPRGKAPVWHLLLMAGPAWSNMTPNLLNDKLTQLNNHRHLIKKRETYCRNQAEDGPSICGVCMLWFVNTAYISRRLWVLQRTRHTQQRCQGCT